MAKGIKVETQLIRGFKATIADKKLYEDVAKGSAEKFGKNSKAYETIMNGIDLSKGTGSQYFFNTEAGLYLPKGQRVAKFNDLSRIYGAKEGSEFLDGTFYTDTPEIILRSDSPSWKNNTQILENLVAQVRERGLEFSADNPLVLSGLNLVRDDNKNNFYGILLKMDDSTSAVNNPRFASGENKIQFGNGTTNLYTKSKGMSRVCFDRSGSVDSDYDGLQDSDDYGRVVIFDAEGVNSKNSKFESFKQEYRVNLIQLRNEINAELENKHE